MVDFFLSVCLSVRLFVDNSTQNIMNGFDDFLFYFIIFWRGGGGGGGLGWYNEKLINFCGDLGAEKMRIEEEKTKRDEAAATEKLKLELETKS